MKRFLFLALTLSPLILGAQTSPEFINFTNSDYPGQLVLTPNYLWSATGGGLVQINLATGEQTYYNRANSDLPRNQVISLTAAGGDAVWAGTTAGLTHVQADGSMNVMNTANSELPFDRIWFLQTDQDGNLWLADGYRFWARYDGQNWQTDTLPLEATVNTYSPMGFLYLGHNGWLWGKSSHYNGALFQTNGDTTIYWNSDNSDLPEDLDISGIAMDTAGVLWVSDIFKDQLWSFDGNDWSTQFYGSNFPGRTFVKTPDGGLLLLNKSNNTFWERQADGGWSPSAFSWPAILDLAFQSAVMTPDNRFWLGEPGLYRWEVGLEKPERVHSSNSPLPNNSIAQLAVDGSGKVWISGGAEMGIYNWVGNNLLCYDQEGLQLHAPQDSNNMPMYGITDMEADLTGGLFVVANNRLYHHENGFWPSDTVPGMPYGTIHSVAVDPVDGSLWITGFHHIAHLTFSGYYVYPVPDFPINVWIDRIAVDHLQNVWLACSESYEKILRFDGVNWTTINSADMGLDPLGCYVRDIKVSESGDVWVVTSIGLAIYNGTDWEVHDFNNTGNPQFNLFSTLAFDGETAWLGYEEDCCGGLAGLTKFENDIWTTWYFSSSDLPDRYTTSLVVDQEHRVWIGTTNGGLAVFKEGGVVLGDHLFDLSGLASSKHPVKCFPNPTSDMLYWDVHGERNDLAQLVIIDTQGRIFKMVSGLSILSGENRLEIALDQIQEGVYFWILTTSDWQQTGRFYVNMGE